MLSAMATYEAVPVESRRPPRVMACGMVSFMEKWRQS